MNSRLAQLGRHYFRSRSLTGNLRRLIGLLIATVIVGGLVPISFYSYRVSKQERAQSIRAIGTTLSRMAARSLSLGDFLSVEESLQGASLPEFVCRIEVQGKASAALAAITNHYATSHCQSKDHEVIDWTFPVYRMGELDQRSADSVIAQVHLKIDDHDLTARAIQVVLISLGVGAVLLLLLTLLGRFAVKQALNPLSRAVDSALGNQEPGVCDSTLNNAAPEEIKPLLAKLDSLYTAVAKEQADASVGKVAAQVAHDIRSPLSALEMVASMVPELAEDKRIIIRSATGRIRDIANDLIEKSRSKDEGKTSAQQDEPKSVQLLSSLIDSLITEKRIQYRSRIGIEIKAPLEEPAYGLFSKIQPNSFKRVLSNLVDNAVEAVGEAGEVRVVSAQEGMNIVLEVQDTGSGMSADVLAKLGEKGFSFGKQGGLGLGLHHARQVVESWGGALSVRSELGKGTTLRIVLKPCESPAWFLPSLALSVKTRVVVLDDDTSIHQIWDRRLRPVVAEVIHFSTPDQLRRWVDEVSDLDDVIFLVDYELIGHLETGLDLIEELALGAQGILVTSRYEEKTITDRCNKLRCRLIPKTLARLIPLSIEQARIPGELASDGGASRLMI